VIKTAIVGFGMSAKTFHIPFIKQSPDYELVAISTSHIAGATVAFPRASVHESALEMITSTDADLIIITAPNDVHYNLAHACLMANKHVVVEKPFVTQFDDGVALMQLAAKRGLVLTVYHNRRWDGDFLTIQKLVKERRLGKLRNFESHFDRFRPKIRDRWREKPGDGTGIWYDLGPHLLDQALVLFGMPQSVTGRCLALRNKESVCDYFHVMLHYPMGDVILHSSPYAAGPNTRFHMQGTQGSFIKMGLDPQESRLSEGAIPKDPDWSQELPTAYGTFYSENAKTTVTTEPGAYQAFYQALSQCISIGAPPPVDPWDALLGLYLIQLAEKSSSLGQRLTVEVPEKTPEPE
jgi:scyllo-inositol 2-dehydrogenase (NADP+)